jgi:predicted component of viral defense system (DUF524 family)
MTQSAELDLVTAEGSPIGTIMISCLPDNLQWRDMLTLVDLRATPSQPSASAPVQLLEEVEYRFELGCTEAITAVEPSELCSPSDATKRDGRLKVGRSTGSVRIEVTLASGVTGSCEVEVRSRKLNYDSEYRFMLTRIATEAAELAQSTFAPSALRGFEPSTEANAETLYQRFAFLQALVESGELDRAFQVVRHRPHLEYRTETLRKDPGRALRPSSDLARQLVGPGPRQRVASPIAGLHTAPLAIDERCHVETFDTVPNRFVRFAVHHWRNLADDVADRLGETSAADQRGRREALQMSEILSRLLATPALAEAGELTSFPQSNTTLQGRSGYREIFRSFLLGEAAATITWDDGPDLFRAGQRDVATLYEYWVFLELVRIVESLPGFHVDRSPLTRSTGDGLALDLNRKGKVLRGSGHRRGREVQLELCFNKTFRRGSGNTGSWTVEMRPDCSLRLTVTGLGREYDTWVHFDAKYRIHNFVSGFADDGDGEADQTPTSSDRPQRADLAKMHAYRDAIRRSAGAYVLYPGDDDGEAPRHQQYHEILPGLGAFVLRPTDTGTTSKESESALLSFLEDVITHVAAQGTGLERSTYWVDKINAQSDVTPIDFEPSLHSPPADTQVLLGFLRSPEHLAWVAERRRYNLRADHRRGSVGLDSPTLATDFVVLYMAGADEVWVTRTTGALHVESAADLAASGYPEPRGERYLSLGLDDLHPLESISAASVQRLASRRGDPGGPVVVTWSDLFANSASE